MRHTHDSSVHPASWENARPFHTKGVAYSHTETANPGLNAGVFCCRRMCAIVGLTPTLTSPSCPLPPARHCLALLSTAGYRVISSGTCASAGLRPITLGSTCEAAAAALKLSDTTAERHKSTPRPEGCYWLASKQLLYLSTDSANKGNGAETSSGSETRHPICVTSGESCTNRLCARAGKYRGMPNFLVEMSHGWPRQAHPRPSRAFSPVCL